MVRGAQIEDLTEGQTRKPLVGAVCRPFAVHAAGLGAGTLLVASDGLLRYAKPADIARLVAGADLDAAARGLVDLVRLHSGALPDDVAVVLCREVEPWRFAHQRSRAGRHQLLRDLPDPDRGRGRGAEHVMADPRFCLNLAWF